MHFIKDGTMKTISKETLFSEGNIRKTIFRMAIPLIISQIINVLYNIVDRMYIGNIPGIGRDALAGVGVVFPILMITAAFAALFGAGGSPVMTIRLGEGKKQAAADTVSNSFIMLLFLGMVLSIVLLLFAEPLLYLFGAKAEIIGYAKEYLEIYALGTVFVMITLGMNMYISAQGYPKAAMIAVVTGAILNILLDPLFIYTLGLGVAGAAWATVISQAVSSVFILVFLSGRWPIVRLSLRHFRLNPHIILSVLSLGISPFVMEATESLVQISFNIQIKAYGGADYITYMNLMTIMLSVMTFMVMPNHGLANAAMPMISYNYGSGNMSRVKAAFRVLLVTAALYTLSFYLLIFLFPTFFVRMFNSDPALLETAPHLFWIFFFGISLMGVQTACQYTFLALKQSLISLILALLRKAVLLIPFTVILPLIYGIRGVFYAEPAADILAIATTFTVFSLSIERILRRKKEELI